MSTKSEPVIGVLTKSTILYYVIGDQISCMYFTGFLRVLLKYQLGDNVVDDFLEETELILIEDEDVNQTTTLEEDIPEVKPAISSFETHACKVLLEDVTKYYTQHKGKKTVKLSRNAFKTLLKCKKSKYRCSYWGKTFYQKRHIVEDERSHTGEKPYKCDLS
uniref:C2H2-type domain-containing protein n=1 Tax=Glossina morsitans morsitans TaxID=37546 RepID=A0A1B0FR30_GLOMM